MVVVFGEGFGEFVESEVVAGHDARYCVDLFEDCEVAVDAGLGKCGVEREDLGNRERTVAALEGRDQAAASFGVPLVCASEQSRDLIIDIGFRHRIDATQ